MARKGVRSKAGWRQIGRNQWVTTGKQARRNGRKTFRKGYDRTGGFYGRMSSGREMKFHDVDVDDVAVAAGGTISASSVNLIAQGVTESQCLGRKCTIRSIGWRWVISLLEEDAVPIPAAPDEVRVVMYLDRQCNGAAATVTDILESANHLSFNNLANKSRFLKLYDQEFTLNFNGLASDGAGVVSAGQVDVTGSFYKKCNIPLEFDSTTGALTEIRSNNIGVMLLSRTGQCGFLSKIRLRFEG